MPVTSPRVCPVLVERGPELAFLRGALTAVRGGRCRLVTICGEAGIGKSRLAAELATMAVAEDWGVVVGGCCARDADVPLAIFADALRQALATDRTRTLTALEGVSDSLVELLPELRTDDAVVAPRANLPPEQARRLRFEALALAIRRFAGERPLLVLLEDLHWADPTSLEFLEVLPRRLAALPILIVGTTRTDESDGGVAQCLTNLRRARLIDELALEPLSEAAVGTMLTTLVPTSASAALVSTVHRRTGGNPFFVEEVAAEAALHGATALLAGDAGVPRSIGDVVAARLAGLDDVTRRVATIAAVVGQRADPRLVLAAGGLTETELAAATDALIGAHLLVEVRDRGRPALAFRHALTRDAIHDRLPPSQRRRLHRAVAEALRASADVVGAPDCAELGYHFHAAAMWEPALTFASEAGDQARRGHATVESLGHYRRALDAALALDHPAAAALHRRCGQALSLLGVFDEARRHLEGALHLARTAQDAPLAQAILTDLAALFASRDYTSAERFAAEALDRAQTMGEPRREALALNLLGNMRTNRLRTVEGRALHEEALARFVALGDEWGIADALDLIGMAHYLGGEVPEARDAFGRAAAAFETSADPVRVASALSSRGLYLAVLDGPCATDAGPAAFRADAARGLRLCEELAWRAGEAYARVALATVALGEARYDEADREAHRALAIAEEIEHQQWQVIALLTLGILDADLLADRRAAVSFERAFDLAREIGSAQWVERLETWLARCRARIGDLDDASTALGRIVPGDGPPTTIGQRRALLTVAEIALARDQPESALAVCDRLLDGAAGARPAGIVLCRAESLAALQRTAEADADYADARRLAAEVGPRSVLWRVAESESRIARAEIGAIAATIPDDDRRAAFLAQPLVRPFAPTGANPPPGARDVSLLSRREQEVAVCVGRGLTNKQIARELFIAEKTVEMHVGHCLDKLGLASRAQLAVWAVGAGLVDESPPRPAA